MAAALRGQMRASEADSRTFALAILVSILAHALLLFVAPALRESSKRPAAVPGPIVARLVQPRPATAPASQPAEEAQKPKAEETPPPPPVAKPVPAPLAKAAPVAKAAPKAPSKPAAREPQTAPQQAAPAPSTAPPSTAQPSAPAAAGPVAKADPQPSAPAPSADADTGSLRQYHALLITTARKYKRYPRVAMDNNWEGAAEVLMVIGANGMISSISIKTSSGYEVLDQQAIEMFKKTKPLVPIPAALRGKEFSLVLKAIYNLKEPGA